MKQVETPRVMIRMPPIAGPMTRAPFMTTLLRLTALDRRSRSTISETNVWRAGLSNRFTTPRSDASTNTCQSWIEWVRTSTPSSNARTAAEDWVAYRTLRLSSRSAIRPPKGPSRSKGTNWSPAAMATSTPVPCRRKRMR